MKENDYLLNLSAVKWEYYDFDKKETIRDKGFRNLDSNYLCDVLFLERITKKAKELGYIYEHTLNTLDVEEYDYNHPPYEKLWVYSKTDEPYPESVIGVYRAHWYRAENIRLDGKIYISFDPRFASRRYIDEDQREARIVYDKFTDMFCGKDGYSDHNQGMNGKVRSIVIVIVDVYGEELIAMLQEFHKPYILFCVIVTSERKKIWIGFDTRRSKEEDGNSYYDKIKELEYLLSD